MPVSVSTTTMIKRCQGLIGTHDLTQWEEGFIEGLVKRMEAGEVTRLTDKQVETLDAIHLSHFA